jgi:8-amino-7-oxononanoate synthase
MRTAGLAHYERTLAGLERKGRGRVLVAQTGFDFTSNDYLGLARSDRLKDAIAAALALGVPVGAGGSRLLRGNDPEHEALETEAAAYFGAERALYFGSGYAANVALFSTLPQREDIVVYDALIHASAHEGIAGQQGAGRWPPPITMSTSIRTCDRTLARAGGTGHPWIAVESLYSMDGDRAPMAELAAVAEKHGGFL